IKSSRRARSSVARLKHGMWTASLIILLAVSFSGSIHATTYHVAKTGSDNYGCARAQNPENAKFTVMAGVACLSGGDTLEIHEGTYVEDVEVNVESTADRYTRVKRFGSDTVILKPDSGNLFGMGGSYLEVDGLIVDGADLEGWANFTVATHHGRVINCEIKNT